MSSVSAMWPSPEAIAPATSCSSSVSYSAASAFERYIDFAHKVIRDQQERIEAMEPEINKVRDRLVEASRERKVVEKLKERRWNEFMYEYNREVAKENDDTNQKIFVKKRIEEAMSEGRA